MKIVSTIGGLSLFVLLIWLSSTPGDEIPERVRSNSPLGLRIAEQRAKEKRRAEGYAKLDAPGQFFQFHFDIRTPDGASGPTYPLNFKQREIQKAKEQRLPSLQKTTLLPWIERGPGNVAGRTRGLIVDPDDPTGNTWYAGSVGGGIWKTTDAGTLWTNKTPGLPNLATTTLAMAPSNRMILYAGTGEGFGNIDAIRGDGIWKSTDRGETWAQLASTASIADFAYVNRIIVDPADENILLAATNTGILRSTNGGMAWSTMYAGSGRMQQIVAHPSDFSIQYATQNGFGVVKSTDRGLTWLPLSSGLGNGARFELAIAPSNPDNVYVAVETNSSTSDLYVSDNGGTTWMKTTPAQPVHWLSGQGWYNNTIAVHPFNSDIVFVGGLDLYGITMGQTSASSSQITRADTINTRSFLSFVNFGLPFLGGGVGSGEDFIPPSTNLEPGDYVSVELRFGQGKNQKAHRFTPPDGSDQPVSAYQYAGYIDVPFEVWDITGNRQLMVSFRDQIHNGVFDLRLSTQESVSREYIFIHAVSYDNSVAHPSIALNGGMKYKNIYGLGPALAAGASWNPDGLPPSTLRITYENVATRARTHEKLSSWQQTSTSLSSSTYVHADHHAIMVIPNAAKQTFRLLNASDGGISISNNGGLTWDNPNRGYSTSQFYGADKKPGEDAYIGGMQDNGTWKSGPNPAPTSEWESQLGGDGFGVSWHYSDPNRIIGSIQYNNFRRTLNGGSTWSTAFSDMTDLGSGLGPFISVIAKSNSDPDLLFTVGSRGVWRSDNFGENWTLSPITNNWSFGTGATAAISLADPQIVWAGVRMSESTTQPGKIWVSTDGGITFQPTNNSTDAVLGRLSGLATHPTEPQTAFALFSFSNKPRILRTTDLGQTWTDISGFGAGSTSSNGFPNVATYTLLVMPHAPNEIWAGTEIGLFISLDNGAHWAYANNGLPAVSLWQLRITDDQVIAATHGRGVWSVRIPELASAPPPATARPPRLNKSSQSQGSAFPVTISLRSAYDSTVVFIDNLPFTTIPANQGPQDLLVYYTVPSPNTINVRLSAFKDGREYRSATRAFSVVTTSAGEDPELVPLSYQLEQNYPNPFNPATTIRFTVPRESRVRLLVYNLQGKLVETLFDQQLRPGTYSKIWTPTDVPSGAYYCRMEAANPANPHDRFVETRKLIVLK
ncbi:MAG: hypothetical protein WEE20_01250 [Bacteroidota bacterium]